MLMLALLATFAAVKLITPQVFLADTPRISPMFISNIQNVPSTLASIPQSILQLFNNSQVQNIENVAVKAVPSGLNFSNVATGVQAAEDNQNNKVYLKLQPGTYYQIQEIVVNGVKKKVLKIYKE